MPLAEIFCSKRQQVWAHHIFWQQYLEAARPWPDTLHTPVFNIWDDVRRYRPIICHTPHCPQCPAWSSLRNHFLLGWEANWVLVWWSDECCAIDRSWSNYPSQASARDVGMQFALDTDCRITTWDKCINGGPEIETLSSHCVLWR